MGRGYEDLAVYLRGPGEVPGLGPERSQRLKGDIIRYENAHGSLRYVQYVAGEPVAALQVVAGYGDGFPLRWSRAFGTVANVYTRPGSRRLGFASALLARARKDFPELTASRHRSGMGEDWVRATGLG